VITSARCFPSGDTVAAASWRTLEPSAVPSMSWPARSGATGSGVSMASLNGFPSTVVASQVARYSLAG
jgi:hypothetical protein